MAETAANDVKLVQSGPSFEIWRGPKGVMRLDWTRKGAVRVIVDGHGHGEFAAPTVRRYDDAVRAGVKVTAVADFWKMTSYDSPFRQALQEWGSKHKKDMEAAVVASTSKLVAMGISVANLAMGVPMRAHSRKTDFDTDCLKLGLPINPPLVAS